jgi:hypothetical protein
VPHGCSRGVLTSRSKVPGREPYDLSRHAPSAGQPPRQVGVGHPGVAGDLRHRDTLLAEPSGGGFQDVPALVVVVARRFHLGATQADQFGVVVGAREETGKTRRYHLLSVWLPHDGQGRRTSHASHPSPRDSQQTVRTAGPDSAPRQPPTGHRPQPDPTRDRPATGRRWCHEEPHHPAPWRSSRGTSW